MILRIKLTHQLHNQRLKYFLYILFIFFNLTALYCQNTSSESISTSKQNNGQKVAIVMKDQADISCEVKIREKVHCSSHVYNALQERAYCSQVALKSWLIENKFQHWSSYIVHMISTTLSKYEIDRMEVQNDVERIILDGSVTLLPNSYFEDKARTRVLVRKISKINTNQVRNLGFNGLSVIEGQDANPNNHCCLTRVTT